MGPVTPFVSDRGGFVSFYDTFAYSDAITAPNQLAAFVGTGSFNLQVVAHYDLDVTPRPDLRYEIPLTEGRASVTYYYAPEPASLISMSLGLARISHPILSGFDRAPV
jgi:hypothetical protein